MGPGTVRGWARPARPVAPIAVAVMIVGVWWLVAHNGGAGWVQLLGDVVFGTLLIGDGRAVGGRRPRPRRGHAQPPPTASPACRWTSGSSPARVCACGWSHRPVDEAFVGPVGRGRPAGDRITLVPARRGVHEAVTLDIASAAPFALQWWTRRVRIPLPAALHVSPRLRASRAGAPEPA